MNFKKVVNCRVCGSHDLYKYLDLGEVPLANGLLAAPDQPHQRYPLQVLYCVECSLSQLSIVVDPKILYTNYPYRSSTSETFKRHCYYMGKQLKNLYDGQWSVDGMLDEFQIPQPRLIDIGANDGCLMHQFKRHGFKAVCGFEPDPRFRSFVDSDILMFDEFFSIKSMAPIKRLAETIYLGADFITATNVFAHVDDLVSFLQGIHEVLHPNGTFVVEVPYAYHMLMDNEFDTIYHEHLSYFLMKPLKRLFEANGLHIFKVEEFDIHGGTIRLYASKEERGDDGSVDALLDLEKLSGVYELSTYTEFAERVLMVRDDLVMLLERLSADGKKIVAFGASAKGSTLLNYCGIDNEYVSHIIDDTKEKQGKWMAGTNIPIEPYNWEKLQHTDYILLLVWNFADEIMTKINAAGYKGKWIIPIPEVEVV